MQKTDHDEAEAKAIPLPSRLDVAETFRELKVLYLTFRAIDLAARTFYCLFSYRVQVLLWYKDVSIIKGSRGS